MTDARPQSQPSKRLRGIQAPDAVFMLLVAIFLFSAGFIALNLNQGIAPDEDVHFLYSKHFSTVFGIPPESQDPVMASLSSSHSPVLYYWLTGRLVNLVHVVRPGISDIGLLKALRLFNVLLGAGCVIACYSLAREVQKKRWFQLLPPFLLSMTLMFVVLSGSVSYDNLANLFCFVAFIHFIRSLSANRKEANDFLWLIFLSLGALTKYTVLPLALVMALVRFFFALRENSLALKLDRGLFSRHVVPSVILGILLALNLLLYGQNLVRFGSLLPDCTDTYTTAICQVQPLELRHANAALQQPLSIRESIAQGYPNPLEYIVYSWIPNLLHRIYGVLGHQSYFPTGIIIFYYLFYAAIFVLAVRKIDRPSPTITALVVPVVFYLVILLVMNYSNELVFGFKQIGMQGRYFFPVLSAAYVLMGKVLESIRSRSMRMIALALTLVLFSAGGPINFFLRANTSFKGWFNLP